MKNFIERFPYQIYLVVVGMVWIYVLNFFLQISHQDYVYPDTESYIRASEDFYFSFKPNYIRPSLIAAINGFPLLFGCAKTSLFLWNTIVNLALWFATVILLFTFLLRLTSKKLAFFITLIYIFSLGSLLIVFEFLSETVFSFFLLVSFFLFQKHSETRKTFYLSFGFGLLILSVLIKPVSLLLFLSVCVFLGIKQLSKVVRSSSSLLVYGSIFIVLFHIYSMKLNYGNYTLSYIDSLTYYNYLGTKADCFKNGVKFSQSNNYRSRYFNKVSLSETKKVAFEDLKNQVNGNTFNFFKAYFSNLLINSSTASGYFYAYQNKTGSSKFETNKVLFRGFSRLQNMIYSLFGIMISIYYFLRKKESKIIKIISFSIIYVMAISAISCDQGDRFHIVIYPLILILISKFIQENSKPFSVLPQR